MSLEARIPPPVVALVTVAAMWVISWLAPHFSLPSGIRWGAALALAIAGAALSASGIRLFHRVRTTVDPRSPEAASSLVESGVYRVTRNPMYLGIALVLVAWSVFLSSAWALLGVVAFVLYMSRFQIAPEERALSRRFGSAYESYKSRVRRWL